MKQKTSLKDLPASRLFLCLIICRFWLLINAYLYSWVSHKSCFLTSWDWSAQVRWLGATPPPFVSNSWGCLCYLLWVQADTFLPFPFPVLLLSGRSLWWFWLPQLLPLPYQNHCEASSHFTDLHTWSWCVSWVHYNGTAKSLWISPLRLGFGPVRFRLGHSGGLELDRTLGGLYDFFLLCDNSVQWEKKGAAYRREREWEREWGDLKVTRAFLPLGWTLHWVPEVPSNLFQQSVLAHNSTVFLLLFVLF